MAHYRQHEQDVTKNLRSLIDEMDRLYCEMGGRTNRPERLALAKCMRVLQKEIYRSTAEWVENNGPID